MSVIIFLVFTEDPPVHPLPPKPSPIGPSSSFLPPKPPSMGTSPSQSVGMRPVMVKMAIISINR